MAGLRPEEIVSLNIWKPDIFAGKTLLCTGGAGSICSAQVGALVLLGANAVIIGRTQSKLDTAAAHLSSLRAGATVVALAADVRSPAALAAAVEKALAHPKLGGKIDYVIAGAAGNFLSPVSELSENAFKAVVDIDLLGSYNTVKAVLPHMIARSKTLGREKLGAKILFVSATMHYTGIPFQAHAAAAKAAVDALCTSLAIEVGPYGITCNVIAPGPIAATEGISRLVGPGMDDRYVIEGVPMQKMGTVKDIADATVWLMSPAGDWVTASVVVVDGGSWRTQGGRIVGYPDIVKADFAALTGRKKETKQTKEKANL